MIKFLSLALVIEVSSMLVVRVADSPFFVLVDSTILVHTGPPLFQRQVNIADSSNLHTGVGLGDSHRLHTGVRGVPTQFFGSSVEIRQSITSPQPDDDRASRENLKTYLRSHQLHKLLIELLEQELIDSTAELQKQAIATELIQYHLAELNQSKHPEKTLDRLEKLFEQFPAVATFENRILIAFVKYRRANELFDDWIENRDQIGLRQAVSLRLELVIRSAEQLYAETRERYAELSNSNLDSDDAEATRKLKTLETVISQCLYLNAWSNYLLAISLGPGPQQDSALSQSQKGFRMLLQIPDEKDVNELSPQWFDLSSPWSCRCLLGLAMVNQAMRSARQANHCFVLLGEANVPESIRRQKDVWQFRASYYPGQVYEIADRVANLFAQTEIPTGEYWLTVAKAGLSWPDQQSDAAIRLTNFGLMGLAKSNEFAMIDTLIESYQIKLSSKSFFSKWVSGYISLKKSNGRRNSTLRHAINQLAVALRPAADTDDSAIENASQNKSTDENPQERSEKQSTEKIAPIYRARCRYHYAYALFVDRQFQLADDQLRQVTAVFRYLDGGEAENALWLHCRVVDQLAKSDPIWRKPLKRVLGEFQRDYPNSAKAHKAVFMGLMSDLESEPIEQSISILQRIGTSDPNYERALFEICRLKHLQWIQSIGQSSNAPSLGEHVLSSAEDYVRHVPIGRTAHQNEIVRFVKTCLYAADVCLRSAPPAIQLGEEWLNRCQELVVFVAADNNVKSEFHYLSLSLATKSSNDSGVAEHSNWLISNSTMQLHRRAALIAQVQLMEQEMAAAGEVQKPDKARGLITVLQLLVDDYDANQVNLDDNANARVAVWNLGRYQKMLGDFEAAKSSLRRLVDVRPLELSYNLELARVHMDLKQYDQAVLLWRTIIAGSRHGEETWIEAKYNLIVCLLQSDPKRAEQVLVQTLRLAPQMPLPWQEKFAQIQSILKN